MARSIFMFAVPVPFGDSITTIPVQAETEERAKLLLISHYTQCAESARLVRTQGTGLKTKETDK